MSVNEKLFNIVAEILEIESNDVSVDLVLDESNWDSLAVITFISEVDSEFDIVVSPSKVANVKKVSDLITLVAE